MYSVSVTHHYKLSNVHEELSNDDGPGTKERVKGKKVQNLSMGK
jgi:hypothetical protein